MTWVKVIVKLDKHEEWIHEHDACSKRWQAVIMKVRTDLAFIRGKFASSEDEAD